MKRAGKPKGKDQELYPERPRELQNLAWLDLSSEDRGQQL